MQEKEPMIKKAEESLNVYLAEFNDLLEKLKQENLSTEEKTSLIESIKLLQKKMHTNRNFLIYRKKELREKMYDELNKMLEKLFAENLKEEEKNNLNQEIESINAEIKAIDAEINGHLEKIQYEAKIVTEIVDGKTISEEKKVTPEEKKETSEEKKVTPEEKKVTPEENKETSEEKEKGYKLSKTGKRFIITAIGAASGLAVGIAAAAASLALANPVVLIGSGIVGAALAQLFTKNKFALVKEQPYSKMENLSTEETRIFEEQTKKLNEEIEKILIAPKVDNHRLSLLYARYENEIELLKKIIEFKQNEKKSSPFEIRALKSQIIKMEKKLNELKEKEVNSRLSKSSTFLNTLSTKIASTHQEIDNKTKEGDSAFSIGKSKLKLKIYDSIRGKFAGGIKLFTDSLYNGPNIYMQKFNAKVGNIFGLYKDDLKEYEEREKTR